MTDELRLRFLAATAEEDAALASSLTGLDEPGGRELSGVLGRLTGPNAHELDARARLAARRLLGPLRRHDTETLTLLNKVLDYLDLDTNGRLDEDEIDLATRCIEAFSALTPPALVLSVPELRTLAALLRAIDANDDFRLDHQERALLTEGLADLPSFLLRTREANPRFVPEL